ncbi:MAG: helix-turn-helix domain-containing protein [Fimbriimonadaceae bacterium]
MNLADAIRQAAKRAQSESETQAVPTPAPTGEPPTSESQFDRNQPSPGDETPFEAPTVPADPTIDALKKDLAEGAPKTVPLFPPGLAPEPEDIEFVVDAVTHEPVPAPEPPSGPVRTGNVVRLEMFLSPEQMTTLLKSVIGSQHSVMTIREAAAYLRVNSNALEQMAENGEIPAFQIEGRWRFQRSTVDEWLSIQSLRQERDNDVA